MFFFRSALEVIRPHVTRCYRHFSRLGPRGLPLPRANALQARVSDALAVPRVRSGLSFILNALPDWGRAALLRVSIMTWVPTHVFLMLA